MHSAIMISLYCCFFVWIAFIISIIYTSFLYLYSISLSISISYLSTSNSFWLSSIFKNIGYSFLNRSGGSRIRNQFVIYSLEASIGKSCNHYINKLGFWLSLLGQYIILKLNYKRYSAQQIWRCINCFTVIKYYRFL